MVAALTCVIVTGCASQDPGPDAAASATAAVQQALDDGNTPAPLASSSPSEACNSWMQAAASAHLPDGQKQTDVRTALRNAVRTCRTTDQFATAVRANPAVLEHGSPSDDEAILTLLNDTCHLWNKSDSDALTCRDAELRNIIDWRSSDHY